MDQCNANLLARFTATSSCNSNAKILVVMETNDYLSRYLVLHDVCGRSTDHPSVHFAANPLMFQAFHLGFHEP